MTQTYYTLVYERTGILFKTLYLKYLNEIVRKWHNGLKSNTDFIRLIEHLIDAVMRSVLCGIQEVTQSIIDQRDRGIYICVPSPR